jgi:transglutaminase-like putative cysteine protease/energy-coupling factor transporter transmembrane protein EcfT
MRNGADERVAVTAAAASMLTALTLCPLVQGFTWLFVAAIIIVVVMVSGIVARQLLRWWPAIAASQAVVLLFTLMVLFARSRIAEGPSVLKELFDAGMQATQKEAPPVTAGQGVVLLAAGGAGLVALLVDLLASTLRQPALAGLPLLAVYCVPAALLDGGLPWYYFFVAAAGFLLLLSADSGDRVRGWGRVLTSSATGHEPGRRPSDGGMARGGRRVGVATVLMAVALPALVPGLSNQIIGGSGDGDGSGGSRRTITRINPILDLRKDLNSPQDTPLLSYRTNVQDPSPLRIVTSDVFDGNTWSPSTTPIPRSQRVQNGLPKPPGLSGDVNTLLADTQIRIGPLKETYLPLPYPATKVSARGNWLYDANTLNVIGDGQTTENLSYDVEHLEVLPTAKQLADAPEPAASIGAQYLALPKKMPAVIAQKALEVAKTGTNYQRAVRLQRWFRSAGGFTYTDKAPTTKQGDSSTDAIAKFLTEKHGYCVHFASAMAVMARTLGIPARVAVGFLPGEPNADGTMVVSSHDAHAWPELYFEGVGWVRFEPTPRGGATTEPAWTVPPAGALPEDPKDDTTPEATDSSKPSASSAAQSPKKAADEAAPAVAAPAAGGGVPWRLMLVLLAVVIGLSAPRLAATLTSRRRWSRAAGSAPGLAEAAWHDLRLGLSDLGVRWAASWTPRAVQQRLAGEYQLDAAATAALGRLATEIENARYAPPDDELGRTAAERMHDVAAVVSAVAALAPGRTRWQARLWPSSGVSLLSDVGPWMNSTADRAGHQVSALGTQVKEQVKEKVGSGRS